MGNRLGAQKQEILRFLNENAALFARVSREIWASPELSLQETRAAELYTKTLEEGGFAVERGLGGIPTAFSGRFGSGGPVLGILGEFDALANLSQQAGAVFPQPVQEGAPGHGCGHNMLGAGSLAAAFALKHYLESAGREGTVIFFGCPGEEGVASKAFLAREGYWKQLDAALCWHPADVNEVCTGTNNSSVQVVYRFKGVAAHAAGDPQDGRSALDAAELMNTGVQYLREHMAPECRVHYAFLDAGGVSPNVVQPTAALVYMVRANKVRDALALLKRVDKIAQGAALMTETELVREAVDGTAELVPNHALEEVLQENFEAVGPAVYTQEEEELAAALRETYQISETPGIGPRFSEESAAAFWEKSEQGQKALNDFLLPAYHGTDFVAGSTDVGDVSWQTPTAQIHVTAFPSGAPGHSWQNVSCGGSSIGDKAVLTAGKVLAAAGIDLFTRPELLAAARAEFEKRTAAGYVCPIEPGIKAKALL